MIHTQDFESAQLLPLTATHSVVSGLACTERALVSAFKTWTRSLRIADLVGACVLEFLPDRQENCLVLEGHGETDRPTACGLLVQPPPHNVQGSDQGATPSVGCPRAWLRRLLRAHYFYGFTYHSS